MTFDLAIRNGTLVDGSGAAPVRADVAIAGDRIAEVGEVPGRARREIDAEGRLVTPGFVDIHTHLDAQIHWDPLATSPCWHGVTSVVMGNCGVGFAPCRPGDRGFLARLMESVEDIPAACILEGLRWNWESYGEFLDALEGLPLGLNAGGMVGHCAVRWWAMGERSLSQHTASAEDVERMREIVREGVARGALGFSTSRTRIHRTPDGEAVPGTFADEAELFGIGRVLGELGRGVFEAVPYLESADPEVHRAEVDWMLRLSRETGRPLTFGLLQTRELPEIWKAILEQVRRGNEAGARVFPQTQVRSVGVLFGLSSMTPWDMAGGAWGLLRLSGLAERLTALGRPEVRARLVAESAASPFASDAFMRHLYRLRQEDGTARYDCRPEQSLAALALARGTTPVEAFLDLALETGGRALFLYPFANQDLRAVAAMLQHPDVRLGLADSGAHCGQIMDASLPTFLLSYWCRERALLPVEEAVRKLSSEPAALFGLRDRGMLRPGAYADVNVIDYEGLRVLEPEYVQDFPAGASRFVQRGAGYAWTLVNGRVFMQDGEHTGELAGRVLRSGGAA